MTEFCTLEPESPINVYSDTSMLSNVSFHNPEVESSSLSLATFKGPFTFVEGPFCFGNVSRMQSTPPQRSIPYE